MIIDTTYFYEDLSIAQLTEASVISSVTRYIQKSEPDLLRALLGYALYKDFEANGNQPKYVELLSGKEYTNRYGILTKWRGLKEEVVAPVTGASPKPGLYRALSAYYVYYQYMYYNATVTTGTGEKRIRTENAADADPSVKLVRAWNRMAEWASELVTFLQDNAATYPEFAPHYAANYRSVQQFLTPINRFGI